MKKIIGLIGLLAVITIGVMIASFSGFFANVVVSPMSTVSISGQEVGYGSDVCVFHNDKLVYCGHNTLTDLGKNLIKDRLTAGTGAAVNWIAIGNGTRGAAPGDTDLNSEINEAQCSLQRAQDTSAVDIGNGNWSYSYQWISDCSGILINTTGLYNATSGATDVFFAGSNFTDSVTLQTGDKLNVTWYIFVTTS